MSLNETFKNLLPNPSHHGVFDIDPQELLDNSSKVKIVDVRRPDEFTGELGHIANADLIVLDTIPNSMPKLPKDQTIVFVCRSGGRSGQATAFLLSQGYQNVVNMRGGMLAWNALQFPVER